MRTTTNISITLPPILLKQATAVAKREGRTQSELVREALRRYIVKHEFEALSAFGIRYSKRHGFKPSDVDRLIKEFRAEHRSQPKK